MERESIIITVNGIPSEELDAIWDRVILKCSKIHGVSVSQKFRFDFDFRNYDAGGQKILEDFLNRAIAFQSLSEVNLLKQKK